MKNGANVIACLNPLNGVKQVIHLYNDNYRSLILDSTNRNIGILDASVTTNGDALTCLFRRRNSLNIANYYDLNSNNSPFLIAAYGPVSSTGCLFSSVFILTLCF